MTIEFMQCRVPAKVDPRSPLQKFQLFCKEKFTLNEFIPRKVPAKVDPRDPFNALKFVGKRRIIVLR